MATRRRQSKHASMTRTWGIRLAIVVTVGLIVGAAAGVVTVNTLEPGRPSEPDSLATMLDSIAKGTTQGADRDPAGAAGVATTADDDSARAHSANEDNAIAVPDVVGVEEGAARGALTAAGLTIGSIEFRPSKSPLGTVLSTNPEALSAVQRGSQVSMVLSDGRAPADTLTHIP